MKIKMSEEVDLGHEPVKHLLFILALPAITSQVVNALYNMVGRRILDEVIRETDYPDVLKVEAVSILEEYEHDDEDELTQRVRRELDE